MILLKTHSNKTAPHFYHSFTSVFLHSKWLSGIIFSSLQTGREGSCWSEWKKEHKCHKRALSFFLLHVKLVVGVLLFCLMVPLVSTTCIHHCKPHLAQPCQFVLVEISCADCNKFTCFAQ